MLIFEVRIVDKLLVYENPAEPRAWGCCDHATAFLSWLCYHLPSAVPIQSPIKPNPWVCSVSAAQPPITMEKQSTVMFRNVGQLYFPQTRVECHYSLTSGHRWSSSDWIGIFQVQSAVLAPFIDMKKKHEQKEWYLIIKMFFFPATAGMVFSERLLHLHMGSCAWRLHWGPLCRLLCSFSRWGLKPDNTSVRMDLALPMTHRSRMSNFMESFSADCHYISS